MRMGYSWGIPVNFAPHLTSALFSILLLLRVLDYCSTLVFPPDPQPFLKGCHINHAADFTRQSPSVSLMFISHYAVHRLTSLPST